MKLLRYIIIVLILLFTQAVKSQETDDYSVIDSFVDSLQIDKDETFEELAKNIVKSEWKEIEKARAIFYWIAKNIQYDYKGLETDYWKFYPSDYSIAFGTYIQRKGVCGGYSYLFKFMCNEIGIESVVIDGYSRNEISQAGLPIEEIDHSWNAVKINGKWGLIDVTWANSSGEGKNINNYYFLTPPKEFVANHLPLDDKWQLLESAISKDEFDTYPYLSSMYFKLGFDKNYPKNGLLISNDGTFIITIVAPGHYSLNVKIYDSQNTEWIQPGLSIDEKSNDKALIKIELENQGHYLVKVSALSFNQSSFLISDGLIYYTLVYE